MSLGEDLSLDDIDYIEDEKSRSSNNRVVKIIKRHLVVEEQDYPTRDNINTNRASSHGSDRDSASNRALAGDLASMGRPTTAESKHTKENSKVDDVKSNYTINSYEKSAGGVGSSSLHVGDFDAYSVSIVSDTEKSINPSVAALVGSIK